MSIEDTMMVLNNGEGSSSSSSSTTADLLSNLSQLLHAKAEIFAAPSTASTSSSSSSSSSFNHDGRHIHEQTLRAAKVLFDGSLQSENRSFKAIARLLADIKGDNNGGSTFLEDRIETRSKAAQKQQSQQSTSTSKTKGKGKAKDAIIMSLPMFKPTPLQELYVGDLLSDNTGKSNVGASSSTSIVNGSSASSSSKDNGSIQNTTATTTTANLIQAELEMKMLWEQLEERNDKILQFYKEIVKDGDESDDDDDIDEDDGFDEDEDEDEFGLGDEEEDDDDDDEMMALDDDEDDEDGSYDYDSSEEMDGLEEDDDEPEDDDEEEEEAGESKRAAKLPSKPYFAKLRDDSSNNTDTVPGKGKKGSASAKGKKLGKSGQGPETHASETPVDDGLFSLRDFNSQVLAGEDEMRRYMQSGKSKSVNDLRPGVDGLEDLDDSENEEIDYFAAPAGSGLADEDDDDEVDEDDEDAEEYDDDELGEGGVRPEDMRYSDFWATPAKVFVKGGKGNHSNNNPKKGGKDQSNQSKQGRKGQDRRSAQDGPSQSQVQAANGDNEDDDDDDDEISDPGAPSKEGDQKTAEGKPAKRRVSFHDQVKVQEYIKDGNSRQSAFAKLVKAVGMKEAMRRAAAGQIEDDDEEDEDEDYEDEDEDDEDELDEEALKGMKGLTKEDLMALLQSPKRDALDDEGEEDDEDSEMEDEDEDDEDEDDMSQNSDEAAASGALTMRRLQKDLLADNDDDDEADGSSGSGGNSIKKRGKGAQSRHEARLASLSEQIAALEAENIAEREWTLRGEVNSRARPQNSLLEEDLEFDQAAKVVPVVTEESSLTLEERIKQRILADQFDDVVRKSIVEAAAYIPSRLLDIKDTQNERSLADIYADEFSAERRKNAGEAAEVPEIDAKLAKEHESIKAIFEDVCGKLDALSNAHFTPRAAQTTITTVSNTPTISLESAMPTSMSASSALAPEEVYAPANKGTLVSKSEMTPSQKKSARAKARKDKMQAKKVIDKYGGKPKQDKQAKERAMNSLIGKRGVTVVGKGKAAKSALTGKERRNVQTVPDTSTLSGAKFKL